MSRVVIERSDGTTRILSSLSPTRLGLAQQ
jgi:hypothetical protein